MLPIVFCLFFVKLNPCYRSVSLEEIIPLQILFSTSLSVPCFYDNWNTKANSRIILDTIKNWQSFESSLGSNLRAITRKSLKINLFLQRFLTRNLQVNWFAGVVVVVFWELYMGVSSIEFFFCENSRRPIAYGLTL